MSDSRVSQLPVATVTDPGDYMIINKGNTKTSKISVEDLLTDLGVVAGNGALTIKLFNQGGNQTGTFTANQGDDSTITLPQISYNELKNRPTIGSGTITVVQPGTTNQTFNVNQAGNTQITLKNDNTVVTPGDGKLNIKLFGQNAQSQEGEFTANQSTNSTVTLPQINYNQLKNLPTIPDPSGDGALTIQTSGEGAPATGSFTANQSSGSTLTLPVIRYGDLSGKPSIPAAANNGTITIVQPGTADQSFTVNQSGNTKITLKNDNTVVTPGDGKLNIKLYGQSSQSQEGQFTANQSTNSTITLPQISYNELKNRPTIPAAANNGTITIVQPGTENQTFTVDQAGNTTINLKNDNTVVTPGNGALTIKTAGQGANATGTFTANQSAGSTITLPTIRYGDLSGRPSIGNGTITIKQPGTSDQTFTVNQSGNTEINLKNDNTVVTPGDGKLNIKLFGQNAQSQEGEFTANQSTNSTVTLPQINYNQLKNLPTIPAEAGAGTITVVQPGTTNQTFNVNQAGNTQITLKNDNTVVTPGDGPLTIKLFGQGGNNQTGTYTANQTTGSTITLPQVNYNQLKNLPTLPNNFNFLSLDSNAGIQTVASNQKTIFNKEVQLGVNSQLRLFESGGAFRIAPNSTNNQINMMDANNNNVISINPNPEAVDTIRVDRFVTGTDQSFAKALNLVSNIQDGIISGGSVKSFNIPATVSAVVKVNKSTTVNYYSFFNCQNFISDDANRTSNINNLSGFTFHKAAIGSEDPTDISLKNTKIKAIYLNMDNDGATAGGAKDIFQIYADGSAPSWHRGVIKSKSGIEFGGAPLISGNDDANTLDAYEEGTFSPRFNNAGGSVTFDKQLGSYILVGDLVTVTFEVKYANATSANQIEIQIPFNARNYGSNFSAGAAIACFSAKDSTVVGSSVYGLISQNQKTIKLHYGEVRTQGVGGSNILYSDIPEGQLRGTITYLIA